MLIRTDRDRVLIITQPAHAALSSQLARAWGNRLFGLVEPFDDVCLGALLHDVGWLDWEQAPTFNPATGLPHSFLQLATRDHLDIWDSASRRALAFGRFAALLTSLHFTGLYERFHDYSRDSEDDARDARALVARERSFQERTIAALRSDPATATYATDHQISRNRQLMALWDGMSLAICHGLTQPRTFHDVPGAQGGIDLTLAPVNGGIAVDPWPFSVEQVSVHVDARVLTGRSADQDALRQSLAIAAWETIETTFIPAR